MNEEYTKTSNFGLRNGKPHRGIDYASTGTNKNIPFYAVADGVVQSIQKPNGYGTYMTIKHDNADSATIPNYSCYAHWIDGSQTVDVGDEVKQGQPLAIIGNEGHGTGPHLHLETKDNNMHGESGAHHNPEDYSEISHPLDPTKTINGKPIQSFNNFARYGNDNSGGGTYLSYPSNYTPASPIIGDNLNPLYANNQYTSLSIPTDEEYNSYLNDNSNINIESTQNTVFDDTDIPNNITTTTYTMPTTEQQMNTDYSNTNVNTDTSSSLSYQEPTSLQGNTININGIDYELGDGVTEDSNTNNLYIWHTQEDSKVRQSHKDNDNKVFDYTNPPLTGNPTDDYNCRCWAEFVG